MTDGCCVQCGAERVPLLRQRLPRQAAARRDLRGNRDHPPRQTGTPAGTVQMPSALSGSSACGSILNGRENGHILRRRKR